MSKRISKVKESKSKIISTNNISQVNKSEIKPLFRNQAISSSKKPPMSTTKQKERYNRLRNFVENVTIDIEYMPEPELTERAIAHYNDKRSGEVKVGKASSCKKVGRDTSNIESLKRIKIVFIRHRLSNYDEIVTKMRKMSEVTPSKQSLLDNVILKILRKRFGEQINKIYKDEKLYTY